jgi:hypothetical protein
MRMLAWPNSSIPFTTPKRNEGLLRRHTSTSDSSSAHARGQVEASAEFYDLEMQLLMQSRQSWYDPPRARLPTRSQGDARASHHSP